MGVLLTMSTLSDDFAPIVKTPSDLDRISAVAFAINAFITPGKKVDRDMLGVLAHITNQGVAIHYIADDRAWESFKPLRREMSFLGIQIGTTWMRDTFAQGVTSSKQSIFLWDKNTDRALTDWAKIHINPDQEHVRKFIKARVYLNTPAPDKTLSASFSASGTELDLPVSSYPTQYVSDRPRIDAGQLDRKPASRPT